MTVEGRNKHALAHLRFLTRGVYIILIYLIPPPKKYKKYKK
jgi:hypothetical protein